MADIFTELSGSILRIELAELGARARSEEAREALRAFLEKRRLPAESLR
jgi:hypothetical protein